MIRENGRVSLYLADIRPLYDPVLAKKVYERLGEDRKKKADLCRKPAARAASLAAGFLSWYALEKAGCPDGRVRYLESGAPEVEGSSQKLFLSLSHSGDYAVCALSKQPVGVDLQKRQTVKAGLLRLFYTPKQERLFRERYGIGGCGMLEGEALDAFLREWTVKESYMKMIGTGMKIGFDRICTDPGKKRVTLAEKEGVFALFREYKAPEGYFLSVCTPENPS